MRALPILGVISLALLTGCGVEGEAKSGLKRLLNDPDSVQFFDLKRSPTGENVCGFFNAKNRMGGYVGRTPFFYEGLTTTTAIVPKVEDSDFRALWLGIRLDDFSKEYAAIRHKCEYAQKWVSVCGHEYPGGVHEMCATALKSGPELYTALKNKYDR